MTPTQLPLAFIDGLGGGEMMLIFFVILMLFGGKRLPELARGLGRSVREFKKATAGVEDEIKRVLDEPIAAAKAAPKAPVYKAPPALIEPLPPAPAPDHGPHADGVPADVPPPPASPEKPAA